MDLAAIIEIAKKKVSDIQVNLFDFKKKCSQYKFYGSDYHLLTKHCFWRYSTDTFKAVNPNNGKCRFTQIDDVLFLLEWIDNSFKVTICKPTPEELEYIGKMRNQDIDYFETFFKKED